MSLTDRTNETIPLTMWQHGGAGGEGRIWVDADQDSSFTPPAWVFISLSDDEHDSDMIHLTYEEAAKLHDRLGRILPGKSENEIAAAALRKEAEYWLPWSALVWQRLTHEADKIEAGE